MKKLINFLFILTILFPGGHIWNLGVDMSLYYVWVIILTPMLFFLYQSFPLKALGVLLYIGVISAVNILLGNNVFFEFLDGYLAIIVMSLFSFLVLKVNNFNYIMIFRAYLAGAYLMGLFGIFQFICFYVGFEPGYNYSWFYGHHNLSLINNGSLLRLTSWVLEPSGVAQLLAPGFFISVVSLLGIDNRFLSKTKSLPIIFTYVFTFSSLAMLCILFTFLLLVIHYSDLIRGLSLLLVGFFLVIMMYNFSSSFQKKVNAQIILFNGVEKVNHLNVDASSFTLYNNLHVAKENFKRNPLFGGGLGSHYVAFQKYSLVRINPLFNMYPEYSYKDAGSLFNRILSEFGLIGIVFLIIFSLKNFVRRKKHDQDLYWIVSSSIAVIIFCGLVRKGHYFHSGFIFFLIVYFYNFKEYKIYIRNKKTMRTKSLL